MLIDDSGAEWSIYDVIPRADDRRVGPRRGDDGEVVASEERRDGPERRSAIGGVRPPRLTQGWLCFEKEGERRRLQPIPPDWSRMPDSEVLKLIEKAKLAPHRRTAADRAEENKRNQGP